jgi:guanine deaminase
MSSNYTVVVGTIVHSLSLGELQVIDRGAIVAKDGIIEKVVDLGSGGTDALAKLTAELGGSIPVTDHGTKFIVPGFIDTHCHAPQYVFTGTGMDLPLLKWLEKYTFPCESKFQDIEHAKQAYTRSVKAHLSSGSTFCSYFATIHTPAAMILADVCTELGQRAFIGKVSMDRNSPDFYVESTEQGCEDAELFARKLLEVKGGARGAEFLKQVDATDGGGSSNTKPVLLNRADTPLVVPAITPRFVPTCTEAMMRELGRIAGKYALPIQSHMSENMEECQWVAALHPDIQGYVFCSIYVLPSFLVFDGLFVSLIHLLLHVYIL